MDDEFDCGRWRNGRLVADCLLAGTEFCQFDCPYRETIPQRNARLNLTNWRPRAEDIP